MAESKSPARKGSQKLKGVLDATLKIPGKLERRLSGEDKTIVKTGPQMRDEVEADEDSEEPDLLPILATRNKQKVGAKSQQQQNNAKQVNGEAKAISSEGMMKYEDMLSLLKCGSCSELTCPPIMQCRKGHIFCRSCKEEKKMIQCSLCKQTFVDAPNLAMDRLVRLIAVPCKYGGQGCPDFVFLDTRLQHETLCKFRPVHCQFEKHGCKAIFAIKDMCWHHRMCEFAHYPHPNVLPNMPSRKKQTKGADGSEPEKKAPSACNGSANGTKSEGNGDQSDSRVESTTQTEIKLFPGVLTMKRNEQH